MDEEIEKELFHQNFAIKSSFVSKKIYFSLSIFKTLCHYIEFANLFMYLIESFLRRISLQDINLRPDSSFLYDILTPWQNPSQPYRIVENIADKKIGGNYIFHPTIPSSTSYNQMRTIGKKSQGVSEASLLEYLPRKSRRCSLNAFAENVFTR